MRVGRIMARYTSGAAVAAFVLAQTAGRAAGQTGPGGYGHGPRMMGDGPWMGWHIGPGLVLFVIAAVVAVVFVVARRTGASSRDSPAGFDDPPDRGSDALTVLRARFARGEIDEAEFRQRKRALEE